MSSPALNGEEKEQGGLQEKNGRNIFSMSTDKVIKETFCDSEEIINFTKEEIEKIDELTLEYICEIDDLIKEGEKILNNLKYKYFCIKYAELRGSFPKLHNYFKQTFLDFRA